MVVGGVAGHGTVMGSRKPFRVAAVYDTETTNIQVGTETRAYPILYNP